MNHFDIVGALGISPDNTAEQNMALLRRVLGDSAEDRAAPPRHLALDAVAIDGILGAQRRVRLSLRIPGDCLRRQPTARPARRHSRLSTIDAVPGAPLPHAWIDDEHGNRRAIKDLVLPGRLLLIAGEDGAAWCEAAALSPPRPMCRSTPCASATLMAIFTPALLVASVSRDRHKWRSARAARPLHRLAVTHCNQHPHAGAGQRG